MNYTRQQQLLSLIKRTISTELLEVNHELFHEVVVTDVLLNGDGQECRIWVDAPDPLIHQLNTKYRGEIRARFMKQYPRRSIPRLIFVKDMGEMTRMDELLENLETDKPND